MANGFYAPVQKHGLTASALANSAIVAGYGRLVEKVRETYPNFGRRKSPHGENDFYGIKALIKLLPEDFIKRPLGEILALGNMGGDPTPPTLPNEGEFLQLPEAEGVHPSIQIIDLSIPLLPATIPTRRAQTHNLAPRPKVWRSREERLAANQMRMLRREDAFIMRRDFCSRNHPYPLEAYCPSTALAMRQEAARIAFGIPTDEETAISMEGKKPATGLRYLRQRGNAIGYHPESGRPVHGNAPIKVAPVTVDKKIPTLIDFERRQPLVKRGA